MFAKPTMASLSLPRGDPAAYPVGNVLLSLDLTVKEIRELVFDDNTTEQVVFVRDERLASHEDMSKPLFGHRHSI